MAGRLKGITIDERPPDVSSDARARQALKQVRQKFMIMSGKGGVGKSTVAVNLAMALADRGFRVGLMDVDVHGPDIMRILGLQGMVAVDDKRRLQPLVFSENLFVVSMEALMPDKDHAIAWRGPMKHKVIRQFIADVDWGNLDYMLIDAPPGTGDEPVTISRLIHDVQAVIVTTPQEVSLVDVRKSIRFCQIIGMKIFGLIENMAGYVCPHCGKTIDIFGADGGRKTADDFRIRFLGSIPFDPGMVACGDAGICFHRRHPDSPVSRIFSDLARAVTGTES